MRYRAIAAAMGTACVLTIAALAQGQGNPGFTGGGSKSAPGATQQATVETANVALVYPDRYAVPVVLEPNRKVFVMAPADGLLKSISAPVGTQVRENQEIAQLDRSEAAARAKFADANVKEAQAEVARSSKAEGSADVAQARLDAARAKAELAQIELDRCTLRSPFGGVILFAPVPAGQYVTKGQTLAELADYTILKVLVPVDRKVVKKGASLDLMVEGKTLSGKVMAVVPLPEGYASLRELAMPWAAAWVNIDNGSGALEPGQRVRGPFAPTQPITSVPSRAIHRGDGGSGVVQVVRFGNVLDIPVKILGDIGFERTQISGLFLPTDAAIVESSLPMAAGTVIRFNGEPAVTGAAGSNAGSLVDLTPPVGGPARPGAGRIAPIGSPDANGSKTARPPATTGKAAAPKAAPKPAAPGTPF